MDSQKSSNLNDNYCRTPYIPVSVKELSKVKTLEHWTNPCVRAIGLVVEPSHLVSIFEDGGPYNIKIDLSLLGTSLLSNRPVQLFGKLNIVSDMPCLTVYFSRDMDGDIESYQKALEIQKKYIPHVINPLDDSDKIFLSTLNRLEVDL